MGARIERASFTAGSDVPRSLPFPRGSSALAAGRPRVQHPQSWRLSASTSAPGGFRGHIAKKPPALKVLPPAAPG